MGAREAKLAETEVLFREVNEGIAAAAERLERVVRRRPGYDVVEKVEKTMRRIAERLDPRRNDPEPETS